MTDIESHWRLKSDREILEAGKHLASFTARTERIIRSEMRRRDIDEPLPTTIRMPLPQTRDLNVFDTEPEITPIYGWVPKWRVLSYLVVTALAFGTYFAVRAELWIGAVLCAALFVGMFYQHLKIDEVRAKLQWAYMRLGTIDREFSDAVDDEVAKTLDLHDSFSQDQAVKWEAKCGRFETAVRKFAPNALPDIRRYVEGDDLLS